MSTDPSGHHHHHHRQQQNENAKQPEQQNGSIASSAGGSASCTRLVMDRVLLREVEEIADRVRELEKSVPCQVDIINDDYGRNVGQDPLGVIQDGPRSASGNNICGRASSVGVTMNNTNVMVHGDEHQQQRAGDGADPQPSERLIIKLDSNKSGGGDAERALPPPPPSCPVAIMDGEEEIKALVKELKRKIEYTERMNWLCLSRRWTATPQRKTSLGKHQEVKKRFLEICDNVFNEEVRACLRLPAFDCYEFDDASIISLMQTMFLELGLPEHFGIPMATLREWLYEVYKHYNDVPFHNFRHCFCVTQMMYAITWRTDLISRLGKLEVLILLVSCICHDLDHPGYNNIYQINARTELALRYNDISPLENHHCSIAFRLFEHPDTNIFKGFSKEAFKEVREGIIRCILATDMARHNEIITQFKEITPTFDYTNKAHTNLMCMVLIKVADISNEARPLDVAEPWLDRLLQEFFSQSAAEKQEGLPVTPFMDPEKVSRTGSQVRFIGLVLLPLFETLGAVLTELNEFIIQPARVALDYYKKLNESQTRSRRSIAETEYSSEGGGSSSPQMPRSQSGISVRSKKSIPSQLSNSRASVDEPMCIAAELHDLPEGSESGDSETATEVDVAEKASKFKVDTESSGRSKSSQPPSRKTSKEKRPSMTVEMYNSGRIRGSYGNIHNNFHRSHFGANRAVSLDAQQCQRRMSSDGIQSVISDSSVFYYPYSAHNNCGHHLIGHNINNNINSSSNNNNNNNNHPLTHPHQLAATNINPLDCEDVKATLPTPPQPSLVLQVAAAAGVAGEGSHPPKLTTEEPTPAPGDGIKKKHKREFRFRSLRVASFSSSPPPPQPPQPTMPHLTTGHKSENNSNVRHFSAANACAPTNTSGGASGSRSFFARLRQLTGKFTSFSFDHHSPSAPSSAEKVVAASESPRGGYKVATAEINAEATLMSKNVNLRNAQAESTKNLNNKLLLSKQLCNIAYVQNKTPVGGGNLQRSPNASKLKNLEDTQTAGIVSSQPTSSRNRAYSLDVPTKRYSSGSSSRKSSTSNKNEEDGGSLLVPYPNNNNDTCITCSYCSAELVINAELNPGTNGGRGPRPININVNNLSGCEGSSGDVAHICDDQCASGSGNGGANLCRRKASDDDNELSRLLLMNNRLPSNTNCNNSSSSNSNLSKNVNI